MKMAAGDGTEETEAVIGVQNKASEVDLLVEEKAEVVLVDSEVADLGDSWRCFQSLLL